MDGEENASSIRAQRATVKQLVLMEKAIEHAASTDFSDLPSELTREILARLPLNLQELKAMARVSKGWNSVVQDTFVEMWQQVQRCQDKRANLSGGGGVTLILRPKWLYGDDAPQPTRGL